MLGEFFDTLKETWQETWRDAQPNYEQLELPIPELRQGVVISGTKIAINTLENHPDYLVNDIPEATEPAPQAEATPAPKLRVVSDHPEISKQTTVVNGMTIEEIEAAVERSYDQAA